MKPTSSLLAATLACLFALSPARAEGPYRNPDNKNPNDISEGTYPVPYKMPTVAEIPTPRPMAPDVRVRLPSK